MKIALTDNQKQAIESIDKSMLVVAGAGSGKTLVLVHRFVEILQKQPELNVRNLLAVTYTRKAAKEMRTRIKARLKELYDQAKTNESERKSERLGDSEPAMQNSQVNRWHQCLAEMDSAHIETIHSLCQSILRSFTIEIGLDPQIDILDEIEKAKIMQESIDETFRQIIASENIEETIDKAFLEHFPLETIESFLRISLNNHLRFDQIATKFDNLSNEQLTSELDKLLTRSQKQLLLDLVIDDDWSLSGNYIKIGPFAEAGNKLEEVRQQATQYFISLQEISQSFTSSKNIDLEQTKIKEAWSILLNMAKMGSIRVGGNSDTAKEMRRSIKMLIEKCKDYSQNNKKGYGLPLSVSDNAEQSEHYWRLLKSLLHLTRRGLNIYAAKKLEVGKLDFDDLIAKTRNVLKEPNSPIREFYNNTLAHILVDEFQDTNPIQTEIITLLAGANTKLFLIGDDKQSIYKFQGADVSTFNAWQRKEITSLVFEHSFRSDKSIVDFVNNIFSNLLPVQKTHVDYRAKYSALKALRDSDETEQIDWQAKVEIIQLPDADEVHEGTKGAEIERTVIEGAETNGAETANTVTTQDYVEGRAVANWIIDKVKNKALVNKKDGTKREIDFGDFAVLTARNSELQIFESCLSEFNIPYVTSGGRTFLERQEIYDLENFLLFLSNTSNSHALLAILRSPIFGITDDILHNLASENSTSLWQAMKNYVAKKAGGFQSIAEALIVLKRLLADLPILSVSELVYRIIRDTNYDLVALTLPDGKQRYKNIWKFYMLTKDQFSITKFLEQLTLSRQLAISEANATIDNKHSVKLMTIHAAKGLEFPAVALPFLSNSFNYNKSKLLFHDQYGIVLNTARTEQERDEGIPLSYQLGKTLDDDMDLAEKKRLLYVAMTRARDLLALFTGINNGDGKSAASWIESILPKLNRNSYSLSAPQLNEIISKQAILNDQVNMSQMVSVPINKIEQLIEPMAVNLATAISTLPEVFPWQRITPNSPDAKPSPILMGKFFHRIMEYLPQGKVELSDNELIALLEQFAEEAVQNDFKQILIREGKELLAVYANSKLKDILSTAKIICHEWPYYMNIEGEQLILNRPDLLLESEKGIWYLIDYKTDHFSESDLEQQAKRHSLQLQRYGNDFKKLTNLEAKQAIYFARLGILYEFSLSLSG